MPLIALPAIPYLGTAATAAGGYVARTAAWRGATALGARMFGGSALKKGAGAAVGVGGAAAGGAVAVGAGLLGTLMTAAIVVAGVVAVGALGYGIYKMVAGGGSSAEEVAAENPQLAQALAPAMAPQMNMAPMMPQPVMGQPQYPIMQGGMIPNAAYANQSYPAAVVGMPQMMQGAPANAWQERVGGRPVQQGSYVQSLTDPAAIAAMNNQQIQ